MWYTFSDCMSAASFIHTIVVVRIPASPQVSDRAAKHMQCAEFCIAAVAEIDVVCTVSIDVYS